MPMDNAIRVAPNGVLLFHGRKLVCRLGRFGVRADKSEGDGATPAGIFPLRRVFYRPDRVARPETRLSVTALSPQDGWCDDPADPFYNQFVRLPYPARAENLWREDRAYDVLAVIGYNDDPAIFGKGSAIFLHLMHDDDRATAGCVALSLQDLLWLLSACETDTKISIAD